MNNSSSTIYQSSDYLAGFLQVCKQSDMDLKTLIAKQAWEKLINTKNDFAFLLKEFTQGNLKAYYNDLLTSLFSKRELIKSIFKDRTGKSLRSFLNFVAENSELTLDFDRKMLKDFFIKFLFEKNLESPDYTNFQLFIDDVEELDLLIKAFPDYQKKIVETIFEDKNLSSHIFCNPLADTCDYEICIDLMQENPSIKNFIFDSYVKNIHSLSLPSEKYEFFKLFIESFEQQQQLKMLDVMLSDRGIFIHINNYFRTELLSLEFSYRISKHQNVKISGGTLLDDYTRFGYENITNTLKKALFLDNKLKKTRKTYFIKIYLIEALIRKLQKQEIKQVDAEECLKIITDFYQKNRDWQEDKILVEALRSLVNRLGLASNVAGLKHLMFFNIAVTNLDGDIPKQKLPYELEQTLPQVEDGEKKEHKLLANQAVLKQIKYAFKANNFVEGLALFEKIPVDTASHHYRRTALHYGCMYGDAATVDKLIKLGANVLKRSSNKHYKREKEEDYEGLVYVNVLHIAADLKNLAAVKSICQHTPSDKLQDIINQKNDSDETPLIIALYKKNYSIANILLDHGAANIGYYKNKKPLQLAQSYLERAPDNKALQQLVSKMEEIFKTKISKTTSGVQYFQAATDPSPQQNNIQPSHNSEGNSNTNSKK